MTAAWSFFRLGFFQSFSVALKASWRILKIQSGKPTDITFIKTDTGEIRNAKALQVGTLSTMVEGFCQIHGRNKWSLSMAIFQNSKFSNQLVSE